MDNVPTSKHPNDSTLNELMDHLNGMHAALPDIVWEECSAPAPGTLRCVGMKVRAKYVDDEYSDDDDDADAEFYNATIQKLNDDQTLDVVFDVVSDNGDAETRKNVPLNEIQIPNVSHSFSLGFIFSCLFRLFCAHTFLLLLF